VYEREERIKGSVAGEGKEGTVSEVFDSRPTLFRLLPFAVSLSLRSLVCRVACV